MYDRYIDIDGLPYHVNLAIQGVVEMANNYEKEIDKLKRQIKYLQTLPAQQGSSECNNCHGLPILKFQVRLPLVSLNFQLTSISLFIKMKKIIFFAKISKFVNDYLH